MIRRHRPSKIIVALIFAMLCFFFVGCASDPTYPDPFVAESVDDPTIFVGTPNQPPLAEDEFAAFESRVEELRFVIGECETTDREELLGFWQSMDDEVFHCRAGTAGEWLFYPIDPFMAGGTTAKGTDRLFLSLFRDEQGFVGQVDPFGIAEPHNGDDTAAPSHLPVEAYLSDEGRILTLIHEPEDLSKNALSLSMRRGIGEENRMALEREVALRLNRMGLRHLAEPYGE